MTDSWYLTGESPAIRRVRSQLHRIAPYFRTALVTGEAGSGKETVARALHQRSGAHGPFVVWRASEIEQRLREAPAPSDLLREAQRGTLFLDGLHLWPPSLQASLLRVLPMSHQLRSERCDLRVVAASETDLRTLATTGQFREELYRRIASVEIALPALRTRAEDIPATCLVLLRQIAAGMTLSTEALAGLERHYWPANVSGLAAALHGAATSARGLGASTIALHHLPLLDQPSGVPPPDPLRRLEKLHDVMQRHVLDVLTRCAGNKLRASEILGISRSTLYRMLEASSAGGDPRYMG